MARQRRPIRMGVAAATALALLMALLSTASPTAGAQTEAFTVSIFHHNDAESEMLPDGDIGGAARFVQTSWDLRAGASQRGNNYLMINAGDSFLASPEFASNPAWRMHDSTYLNMVRYDAMAIGNHEFDFGPGLLANFIDGFAAGGMQPPFISANLDFSNEPALAALAANGTIAKSTVVERDGVRFGIVGATTENLPFISSPGGVVVNEVIPAVQAEVDRLTAAGIENIILLSHLQGLNNDAEAVAGLRGVDVAIGGGGDELQANAGDPLLPGDEANPDFPYPIMVTDADGKAVPLASGPGDLSYIGELEVTFDGNGTVIAASGRPHPIIGGNVHDTTLSLVEEPVSRFVDGLATRVIGSSETPLNGERNPGIRTQEEGLGSLMADALLWQANELAAEFGAPTATVGIQNGGGLRNNDVRPAGPFTALDTFDIAPFANFVTVVADISPTQFKEIMENAYSNVEGASGRFAHIAGFSVVYDPSGTPQELDDDGQAAVAGTRIVSITLDDGTAIVADGAVVAGAPSVNIATIDFLARGGDQYPYRDAPITLLGASYQQALENFITGPLGGVIPAADYPLGGTGRIATTG